MQSRCIGQTVMMMVMVRCIMWQMVQTIVARWHKSGDCRRYTNSWWHGIMQIVMIVQMIICISIIAVGRYKILQAQAMCIGHTLNTALHFQRFVVFALLREFWEMRERETNGKVWDKIRLLTLLLFSALLSNCIEKNQVKWVNDKIRANKLFEYSCLKIFLWILQNWKEVPKSKSFVCNCGLIKAHRRLTETVQNTVIQW